VALAQRSGGHFWTHRLVGDLQQRQQWLRLSSQQQQQQQQQQQRFYN